MATTKKQRQKNVKSKPETDQPKVSKSWLAFLANEGTGKILDMKAVLK